MNALESLTLVSAIAGIRQRKITPGDVWHACSEQIQRLDPVLNAFITRLDEYSSRNAGEPNWQELEAKALAGAPVAVKDLFDTAGVLTTAGSLFFKDNVPEEDAVAVTRIKAAGGSIIGKTNTHEIALGVTTVNPHFGACRNPWDISRITGGSSGGSAVAVATGMALGGLGTDTGGSVRIPASLCGVVGLKPTYGRISLRGVIPLSWNLDHVGSLARTVSDAGLLLQIMAGPDQRDPVSAAVSSEGLTDDMEQGVEGWRIALAVGAYVEDCDPEVTDAVRDAATVFEHLGARVERMQMDALRQAALANGLMTQADAAAFHKQRLAEHPNMFGEDVRQRLETGRDTSASDYVFARRTQVELRHWLDWLLTDYQVLLLPTTPIPAPLIEGGDAVEHARRLTRFTAPFNLTGLPAISIPCGFSKHGLPIGLQIVGAPWHEARVLRSARAYERETAWGTLRPSSV